VPSIRRDIDPQTRDYTLTLGSYDKDATVTSKVTSRMGTQRGSIIPLPNYGSRIHTIKGPVAGWQRLVRRYTEEALADMVRAREVNALVIESEVESNETGALLVIILSFRDRRGRPLRVRYTHRLTGA
jgi:hypothetical protein